MARRRGRPRRRRLALAGLAVAAATAQTQAAEEETAAACSAGGEAGQCLVPGDAGGDQQEAYHWPRARGQTSRYSASPFAGPGNLTVSPTWSWHHPLGRYHTIVVGGPLFDERSNIYLAAAEGIRKFSKDGELLWTYTVAWSTGLVATCPSMMDGALYGNTKNGYFFAVNMETGQELWSVRAANGTNLDSASVEAHDGAVLAAAEPGAKGGNLRVLALEASSGRLLWDFRPDAPLQNFMPFVTANRTVIFQDQEATVYHLWLRNGSLIWKTGHVLPAETPESKRSVSETLEAEPSGSAAVRPPQQPPPEPVLPVRRGPPCPEFPVAEGLRLTLQVPNATGSSVRTVHLWRRNEKPGGMVAMWFHRSSYTLLPWVREKLLRPRAALFSYVPAARSLVLAVYGSPLLFLLQIVCRHIAPSLRAGAAPASKRSRLRCACSPLLPLICLLGFVVPLLASKLLWWHVQSGAVAYEAYGPSADAILDAGGVILGFDGDFDAVPFYGWQSVVEERWAENDDWRLIDETVACVFEKLPGLDRRHVHAAGFSAGGTLATKVGFMRPQYIASVAPISGFLVPLLRHQWPTPRPGLGEGDRHHFAAMITVGGEDDFGVGFGPLEGPAYRYPWQAIKVASQFTRDTLLGRGQLAFVCDHGMGHDERAPREMLGDYLHSFFRDHPYGATSPYLSHGLPSSFNRSACEDTRGLGRNGSWHYSCCSHSTADADDRTHWFSMAHLQTLKQHEGVPDAAIPYMAPSNVGPYINRKLWEAYGRDDPTVDPSEASGTARSIGVYDGGARTRGSCDPSRMRTSGGRRFTVGGASLGPNGLVFAVSGHQTKLSLDLPGCLHAYRLSDGQLLWQQGLPHPAYRATVGQLRGYDGLSVVIPTGKNPFFPGKLSFSVHVFFYGFGGLLATLALVLCGRCCFGWRFRLRRWCLLGLLVGTALGCALGAARLLVSNPRPTEVWAFEAATGRLRWRFEAPLWMRMAAAGDDEGLWTRMRLGWFRTICLPSAWSSATVDGNGTVYIGHMSGKLYAIFGDVNGDGVINGSAEVSSFDAGSGFPPPGPSLAPGLLAAASCDSLLVFR